MPPLLRFSRRRRPTTELGKCLVRCVIFLHSFQTFLGLLHFSAVVRLISFVFHNSELFNGKAWFLIKFFILGPFAFVSMALIYVQLTTVKTILKERTVGMNLKEYKNQIYLGLFVVLITVANFYFHTSTKIRFNLILQSELKRMISEYQSSKKSKNVLDIIQVRYDCCGSEEPMDWVEEREKQLEASPQKTHNSSIFPMSCCIENICGSKLDVFLLDNNSAGLLSVGSFVKSNGCAEKIRHTIAATWMGSSFLFFLFPIIVEMIFVIVLFLGRILNKFCRSNNLEYTNEGVVLEDSENNTLNLSQHNMERFESNNQTDDTTEYNLDVLERQNSETAPRNDFGNCLNIDKAIGLSIEIPDEGSDMQHSSNEKSLTETWI